MQVCNKKKMLLALQHQQAGRSLFKNFGVCLTAMRKRILLYGGEVEAAMTKLAHLLGQRQITGEVQFDTPEMASQGLIGQLQEDFRPISKIFWEDRSKRRGK